MRFTAYVIKFILLFIFLLSLAAGALTVFSIQDNPLVAKQAPLNNKQIKQVKIFIQANNPTRFRAGRKRATTATEEQLSLLTNYGLARFNDNLQARVKLFKNSLYIQTSFQLPTNPIGRYLNISAELKQDDGNVLINTFSIGRLVIPAFLATRLLDYAHHQTTERSIEYKDAIASITEFHFYKGHASIHYIWNPGVARKIKKRLASSVIPAPLLKSIEFYSHQLATASHAIKEKKPSLTLLLRPMFQSAQQRSKTNNSVQENRALLITLGAYMLRINIPKLLSMQTSDRIRMRSYFLHQRGDLSQHFLVSAALTAMADQNIAQAIGLEKEIDDSAGGSGFSFADLAADRAGVALANAALASNTQATRIQQVLAKTRLEDDFMPSISQLREGMQDVDFKAIYTDTKSKKYQRVIQQIDERIARRPVYSAQP